MRKNKRKDSKARAETKLDKETGKNMCVDILSSVYDELQSVHEDIMESEKQLMTQKSRLITVIDYLKKTGSDNLETALKGSEKYVI